MTPTEVTEILRHYSEWQKSNGSTLRMHSTKEINKAIDAAIEMIERMKAYETALREIEWSNDTEWQADRARAALKESK